MGVVLVTGGSGQVGHALSALAWPGPIRALSPDRAALDLTDLAAAKALIAAEQVVAVINCAAYTAVDRAESEVAAAFEANALAPAVLAQATREADVPLVHVSTDYVFDGESPSAYEVDDPIRPVSVYGASKAAGEYAVRLGNPRSATVRTAWVVSDRRANFVKTMLRLGQERDVMRVVADQRGAPTFAEDLAQALATIALRMIEDRSAPTGIFHFSNDGPTTWHGFAGAIFEEAAARGLRTPRLEAIETAAYPTPARRPANSLLSTARISREYGVTPAPWRAGLGSLVERILKEAA